LGDITNAFTKKVSKDTIRTELHKHGLNSRVAKKKPFLTNLHKKNRLEFALDHKSWTLAMWRKVVWTDEATFEIGKNSRVVRVWRTVDQANDMDCLVPTFKSNRSSLMVWGAIRHGEKSELAIMDKNRRTAKDFVDQVYDGPLRRFWKDGDGLLLMEDGAPVHRSNAPKEWRINNNVEKMVWPAQSPDLNPIENLWKQMKDKVQKRNKEIRKVDDLAVVLKEVWAEFDEAAWNKLVDSMPERVEAVIKAKGGSTRW
jgi:hypothetical protein